MNKIRRDKLIKLTHRIAELRDEIENLCAEEQDYFDAMPESLRESPRGEKTQEGIALLEMVASDLDGARGSLEDVTS